MCIYYSPMLVTNLSLTSGLLQMNVYIQLYVVNSPDSVCLMFAGLWEQNHAIHGEEFRGYWRRVSDILLHSGANVTPRDSRRVTRNCFSFWRQTTFTIARHVSLWAPTCTCLRACKSTSFRIFIVHCMSTLEPNSTHKLYGYTHTLILT